MITAQEVQSMLDDFGETITLRRIGTPNIDVACVAKVNQPSAAIEQRDISASRVAPGNIAQFRRSVIISDAEIAAGSWPGPPRRGDQIIFVSGGTATVQSVDTTTVVSTNVLHVMNTVGA